MAKLYERKWWKKMFKKSEPEPKIDTLKDIEAIREYLEELNTDAKTLITKLKSLEELEKERQVNHNTIAVINLQAQGKVLDQTIDLYEALQNDIDINGLRLKMICKQYLKNAQKAGMTHLVEEKKNSDRWKLQW